MLPAEAKPHNMRFAWIGANPERCIGPMTASDCSPEELAALIEVSTRSLMDLAKRGHVSKAKRGRYRLAASVTAYCAHLRGGAAGRGGDDQVATLTTQRARLAREMADAAAAKNAVIRGTMVAAAEVEREWSDVLRTVRAGVLAVPSRSSNGYRISAMPTSPRSTERSATP